MDTVQYRQPAISDNTEVQLALKKQKEKNQ